MTRSKVKVKGTEVQKLQKWSVSKSVSSVVMHVIKTLMVDYDTPRQYVNFNRTDFWYSSSFGVTWPSNIGCSIFGKRILSLTRSHPAVPYGACYYYYYYWLCYCCSINGDSSVCSVCVHAIILRIFWRLLLDFCSRFLQHSENVIILLWVEFPKHSCRFLSVTTFLRVAHEITLQLVVQIFFYAHCVFSVLNISMCVCRYIYV